jgi:alpha-glucosidase (family GH31 glycosyl hydrolase)
MDWHITFYKLAGNGTKDQAGQDIGWTGFTFDEHLFPNYEKFLQWCKQLGIKNTLNVHPASGK